MTQSSSPEPGIHFLPEHTITIQDFSVSGLILDIGGGGEGVIGRLKGSQVVAIDLREDELEETPDGPLKLVMDARELTFLDESFEVVTAFFSLMYIDPSEHYEVLRHAYRVLKPGGRLLIWDLRLPAHSAGMPEVVALPLKIKLPAEIISTGYGARWPREAQDEKSWQNLASLFGLKEMNIQSESSWFFLELQKPAD